MPSAPDAPVEWVAITFPGTTLGAGVAAPLAEPAIAESLQNDTTTLVLVWENLWASGFADAVRTHGGTVLAYDRVLPAAVATALAGTTP
jgi:hypothetical protein